MGRFLVLALLLSACTLQGGFPLKVYPGGYWEKRFKFILPGPPPFLDADGDGVFAVKGNRFRRFSLLLEEVWSLP
ncbi:MAG: hypothetical protein ACUVQD_03705 [Thermaceae bacterium]